MITQSQIGLKEQTDFPQPVLFIAQITRPFVKRTAFAQQLNAVSKLQETDNNNIYLLKYILDIVQTLNQNVQAFGSNLTPQRNIKPSRDE